MSKEKKIMLDWSKFKVFTEDKIKVTEKMKSDLGRAENIEGKGENAVLQHFLIFLQCFRKSIHLFKIVQRRDCVAKEFRQFFFPN